MTWAYIRDLRPRLNTYFKRHGVVATLRRAMVALKHEIFPARIVLFCCDLSELSGFEEELLAELKVEVKVSASEIDPQDFQQISEFWNPQLSRERMTERFGHGAVLWLIKSRNDLAGYGWTLKGGTIEPHCLRLGKQDVHMFDFFVFPEHRGKGLNPVLVRYILGTVASQGAYRAFLEVAEWNQAQLSSIRKTPFRWLGAARKQTIFGRTLVWWDKDDRHHPSGVL